MKNYYVEVKVKWATSFEAKNKKEFIESLKDQFKQDYNICLSDDEIGDIHTNNRGDE